LADELLDDLDCALFAGHKADTLARHQRPRFDVAVNDRAPQRTGPWSAAPLVLKAGIARTYIYQFTDYGSDGFGAFGLLKADGSPKPAYTELSALLTELDDTAQSRPTDELTLAVTGDFQDVETVLFEKSDRSYRLAIWLEKPAYDPKTGAALEVPGQVVALAMPSNYHARRLLTFSDTGAMITKQLAGTAASLEISVQDNVTLIDIARIGS